MSDRPAHVERDAARAIITTTDREVLLMQIRHPDSERRFWITPGGGLESGETDEQALRRELREEVGLVEFELGPLLWRRQHTYDWEGRRHCQSERYYGVSVPHFEPWMSDVHEARAVQRFRWWPLGELDQVGEVAPVDLARIVSDWWVHGPPAGPLDVEVVVD